MTPGPDYDTWLTSGLDESTGEDEVQRERHEDDFDAEIDDGAVYDPYGNQ